MNLNAAATKNDLRSLAGSITAELRRFAGAVDKRFDRVDKRLDGVDKRLDGLDKRFDDVDKRFDGADKQVGGLKTSMTRIESALDWMVGRSDDREARERLDDHERRLQALETKPH